MPIKEKDNYVVTTSDGKQKQYWPMHGNIDSPVSIMSGFDQLPVETVKDDIEQLLNSFDVEVVNLKQGKLSHPFIERYNE